ADLSSDRRGHRAAPSSHSPDPTLVDRAIARRRWGPVPRERDRVPAGDGGARSLPQALPCLRRAGAAHSLRRERGELLPPLPDGWKNTRRPLHVAAPHEGLAALVGGVGGKVRGEPGGVTRRS